MANFAAFVNFCIFYNVYVFLLKVEKKNLKSACDKRCSILYIIYMLIFMSPYKVIYPNTLRLISKNPQGTHKHAKITLFIRRKCETTIIAELFGVLAETLPRIMIGLSSVTPVVRFGCKLQSNISLDQ